MSGQCSVAASDVVVDLHKTFSVLCSRSTTAIMGRGRPTSAMGNCTHRAGHSSVLIAWHNHQFTVLHSSALCRISRSWPRLISARDCAHPLFDLYYNSTCVYDNICVRMCVIFVASTIQVNCSESTRITITWTCLTNILIYVRRSYHQFESIKISVCMTHNALLRKSEN